MKKEQMLSNISNIIDIIETALDEIEDRIDYPVLNDKIAALGNYAEDQLPLVNKLTQYVVNNSDDFVSKRGKGGGVLRKSFIQSKIDNKKISKSKTVSPAKMEVIKSLETKMVSAADNLSPNRYPLDEDENGDVTNS